MKQEVLIVGGGFAGLAAGVELSSRGYHVTLIERRGHLGGRAYSFQDPVTGSVLDNGQHILMGCYRETLAFLEKIGTRGKVQFQRNLSVDFGSRNGKTCRFRAMPLPSPVHLLGGFLAFRGLSLRDKWPLLKIGKGFPFVSDDKTIPEWLTEAGQTNRTQERFWNPFALAALNDRPQLSSAKLFEATIKEALLSGKEASRIGIPMVGLSELYCDQAGDFIERNGGQILLKTSVRKLHFSEREFQEVELEGGRRISAEALLLAVPFTAIRKILPDRMLYQDSFFSPLVKLATSPIVSINLWTDREITNRPFVGFWGTKIHWLFNKRALFGEKSPYVTVVISGAREELNIPGPSLVETALREIQEVFPRAKGIRVVRSMVLKEPEATIAPAVGVSSLRLSQKTPYPNLFLAGDWTDTGLPGTIESAVRSAKKAVELVEQQD